MIPSIDLEESRPACPAETLIDFCLTQLCRDSRHLLTTEVSPRLTYEELIGTLLKARDEIRGARGGRK